MRNYRIEFLNINNYSQTQNLNNEKLIEIFSPVFDALSKEKFFEDIFSINISQILPEFNLKNYYIQTFEKLKNLNIKYSSITSFFLYKNVKVINYLKELKIDWIKIKRLSLFEQTLYEEYLKENKNNLFLKNLFELENFCKNLTYLNLQLKGFVTKKTFVIDLNQLKFLDINLCSNISFSKKVRVNLKKLIIKTSEAIFNELFELPELEELNIEDYNPSEEDEDTEKIDFKNLKKLKVLSIDNILNLADLDNNIPLEKLNANPKKTNNNFDIYMIEKILLFKKLKEVTLKIEKLDKYDKGLSKILGTNNSITKLILNKKSSFLFNDLHNKFPNLSEVIINEEEDSSSEMKIKLKENLESKIKKIELNLFGKQEIELFCQSFEKLEKLKLMIVIHKISEIDEVIPLFNSKCDIIFNNLNTFSFNLKNFTFWVIQKNIKEGFFNEFIKKLLSLNLNLTSFEIYKRIDSLSRDEFMKISELFTYTDELKEELIKDFFYTEKELIEIYPDLNIKELYKKKIFIKKLDKYNN